ncbi:MAG: hypothetical protein CFH31_00545 [Alphaproteobacteria bacterium MarineAlpha9_Bin1]|nr:MAG: hypothetical protein CFH31_00545 [Alphaproteobacteria bacterium MarineAlpha9_Bin1]
MIKLLFCVSDFIKDGWNISAILISSVILVPVISILVYLFYPTSDIWSHLIETVLYDYVTNSLILVIFVALGTAIIGVSTAWIVTMFEFPLRSYFEWFLVLPLAIPSYALSYVYTELFGLGGIAYINFKLFLGISGFSINFYSLPGAIFIFTFSLFPYVYLLSKIAFVSQSTAFYEVARLSGSNSWNIFTKIAIPLSRPAIVGGIVLVSMETLADYGVADYLGINTFTKGIFRTWFNLGDHYSAAKLASMLLLTVAVIITLERIARGGSKYTNLIRGHKAHTKIILNGFKSALAIFLCSIPVVLGFIIPFYLLSTFSVKSLHYWSLIDFIELTLSSFGLALSASLVAIICAILIVYAMRLNSKLITPFARLASLGYSIPGAVAAVGILFPLVWIDNFIDNTFIKLFNISTGLLLTGTWVALLFAYLVRFLALAIQSVENALIKIPYSIDYAARTLGYGRRKILTNVHVRLIWSGISVGFIIIFVDVLKELPATMILRPFGLSTLAIRAHELASDERLIDASLPLITIILVCLVPITIMAKNFKITRGS